MIDSSVFRYILVAYTPLRVRVWVGVGGARGEIVGGKRGNENSLVLASPLPMSSQRFRFSGRE